MSSTLHGPEFMIDSPARCQHNDFFHILLIDKRPQDTGPRIRIGAWLAGEGTSTA